MTVITAAGSVYQENKFQTLGLSCLFLTVSVSIVMCEPSNITVIMIRVRKLSVKPLIKVTFDTPCVTTGVTTAGSSTYLIWQILIPDSTLMQPPLISNQRSFPFYANV